MREKMNSNIYYSSETLVLDFICGRREYNGYILRLSVTTVGVIGPLVLI